MYYFRDKYTFMQLIKMKSSKILIRLLISEKKIAKNFVNFHFLSYAYVLLT